MKIISFVIYLVIFFVFFVQNISAKTYLSNNKENTVKSVDIKKDIAIIKMSDYSVQVPLKIMKGKQFYRANGHTPHGMMIGLKYNDTILQLLVIDKAQKNYMVVYLISEGSLLTKRPPHYISPVTQDDIYISSIQYIQSYPLWAANNAMRGFDLLTQKERHIIKLFPAIRLEIADKLCRSDNVSSGIFEILPSNQGINCDTLKILSSDVVLQKLQTLANKERALLVQVFECSQGIRKPKLCQSINKKLANKVLQTRTMQFIIKQIKQ